MTYTPGPWTPMPWQGPIGRGTLYRVEGSDHLTVANLKEIARPPGVTNANASLIAAAPDLLEALVGLVSIAPETMPMEAWAGRLASARAAIAKASGEAVA